MAHFLIFDLQCRHSGMLGRVTTQISRGIFSPPTLPPKLIAKLHSILRIPCKFAPVLPPNTETIKLSPTFAYSQVKPHVYQKQNFAHNTLPSERRPMKPLDPGTRQSDSLSASFNLTLVAPWILGTNIAQMSPSYECDT